jgi:hypothetical protein
MAGDTGSIEIRRIAVALERRRGGLTEERRKNLIALVLAFGALVGMVAFAARPAGILPVGNAALENSLETVFGDGAVYGETDRHDPVCSRAEDGGFVCSITRSRDDAPFSSVTGERRGYEVEVGALGCWTAVDQTASARPTEGCITILDYLGH